MTKFVNPGFPQIMEYQNLNQGLVGTEGELKSYSNTGYYFNLSNTSDDIIFKSFENVSDFYILFDFIIAKDIDSTNTVDNWVKILDIYNDVDRNVNIQLCYRQYKTYMFELAFMLNNNKTIGNTWKISTNNLVTYEFHISSSEITTITVYENCVQKQILATNQIMNTQFNRINFYSQHQDNMTVAISHLIINDTRINNERIQMLTANPDNFTLDVGKQNNCLIVNNLDVTKFKDIKGFGMITDINNAEATNIIVEEEIKSNQVSSLYVSSGQERFDNVYLTINPSTNQIFQPTELYNLQVDINTRNE